MGWGGSIAVATVELNHGIMGWRSGIVVASVKLGGGITAAESYRINIAFRELDGEKLKAETALRPGYTPGDLAFDPLGLAPEDPAEFREMQEKELAHGCLGMIAAAGFLAQEAVTKATWGTVYGFPEL